MKTSTYDILTKITTVAIALSIAGITLSFMVGCNQPANGLAILTVSGIMLVLSGISFGILMSKEIV